MEMEEKNLAKPAVNPIADLLGLLGPDAIVVSTRCSLCNSKYRKEIDEMCEFKKTPTDIRKFLESMGETPPSLPNVCHHVNEHFKKQSRLAVLADFCDQTSNLLNVRRSKAELLDAMLQMGLADLANKLGIPTGGDMAKEKEKTDMVLKVRKDIRETIQDLNEMDDVDAQVKAVQMKFVKVFKAKIDTAKTDTEKQIYISALQDFKDLYDASK